MPTSVTYKVATVSVSGANDCGHACEYPSYAVGECRSCKEERGLLISELGENEGCVRKVSESCDYREKKAMITDGY